MNLFQHRLIQVRLIPIFILTTLFLACAGKETQKKETIARHQDMRILVVPVVMDARNRYSVESLASRYALGLKDTAGQVLALWEKADPTFQRDLEPLHKQITDAHLLKGSVSKEQLQSIRLNVQADAIILFEVLAYGQQWIQHDPLGWELPIDMMIRLEPELGKITSVRLRASLYEAETGLKLGDASGAGETEKSGRGRSFEYAETEALNHLLDGTRGLLSNWRGRMLQMTSPDVKAATDSLPQPAPEVVPAATD